ncbi:MAG: hypothetical protein H3C26_02545 [Rhodocyclaceae bacterium]|nr:hypothetical protein [Rhodocyclaceae bacterium]
MPSLPDDIAARLGACRSAAELRGEIDALCAEFGAVLNVTLLCGDDGGDHKLCVIDLVPGEADVQACAARLGGRIFGFSSVLVELALHPRFTCPRGLSPNTPGCSCVAKI